MSRSNHSKKTSKPLQYSLISHEKFVLLMIVFIAFIFRLYRIHYPLADWHSWRQADTASVTREYVKHGIDLLHPRYHDLSSIPNGLNNSAEGYRMVEFPMINAFVAFLLRLFPLLPLVPTSRFFAILASLGTLLCVYGIVKKLHTSKTALLAAFFFATIPYIVYYSRVILPEPFMLFFSTLSIYTFLLWTEKRSLSMLLISAVSLSSAVLLKPFSAFLAPVYATILVSSPSVQKVFFVKDKGWKNRFVLLSQLFIYGCVAFIPLLLWRQWIAQYPEGIPASSWLFNGNGIRFRPAWFRWLGYERLTKLILGYVGILFLPLAFAKVHRATFIYLSWWVGILLYFSVIATGNVQHDYYQVILSPIVAITLAVGVRQLFVWVRTSSSQSISFVFTTLLLLVMYFFAWQQVKGYFNVNHWEYVEAGMAVDRLVPPQARVVAPAYGGDTYFLFQTNRTGWPFLFPTEQLIEQGATHYVSTEFNDETNNLMTRFEVVEKTDTYVILDLRKPTAPLRSANEN